MSERAVHHKLKVAFNAVIDGNRARAAAAAADSAKPCVKNNKITNARLGVLGSGSFVSSPALSLHLSRPGRNELFCFNLSPFLNRHHAKLGSALSGIFFTRLHWANQGVGCLSLLNSQLLKSPTFPHIVPCHGPRGLEEYMKRVYDFLLAPVVVRRFYSRTNIIEDESCFSQNGFVVDKICLRDFDANGAETGKFRGFGKETSSYICKIEFRHCADEQKTEELVDAFKLSVNTSKEDAVFLNQLQRGEDAVLPSTGELIRAEDVLKEPNRTCFAILDCPTEGHFSQLTENPSIKEFPSDSPKLIAHLTPQDLFSSSAYQRWLESFGDCNHLVLNGQNCIQYTQDEFKQIYSLSHINREVFPQVFDEFIPNDRNTNDNIIEGRVGLSYTMNMLGAEALDDSKTSQVSELDRLRSRISESLTEHKDVLEEAQRQMHVTKNSKEYGYFPRLVVLGSGGTHNHRYRAHPSFLLMIDEETSLLLDCGELALDRIYKVFGNESEGILASIKLIFLSHVHLDHHCGFLTFLEGISHVRRSRYEHDERERIICLLPKHMCLSYKPFVEHLSDQIVLCPLQNVSHPLNHHAKTVIEKSVGLRSINPFPVSHSVLTYGIALDTACGKRLVYSSDTLPMSKELLRCGRNADLLIHDCLYVCDDNEIEANYRKHSTLGGALKTARAINANFTLLTHFSPFLPVQAIDSIHCDNTAMAYDFLSVSLKDLREIPKLEPAIKAIFPSQESDMTKRRDRLTKRIDIVKDLARMM